jgi:hypothetical protein
VVAGPIAFTLIHVRAAGVGATARRTLATR